MKNPFPLICSQTGIEAFVVTFFVSSISFSNNKYFAIFAGKFGAVFASIPFPIFAALYCVLFGLVGMSLAISEFSFLLLFFSFLFLSLHNNSVS